MKKILLLKIMLLSTLTVSAQCFESLTFGSSHTIGQKADGTLWGWGLGYNGQLMSSNSIEPNPIQLGNETNWSLIENGAENTFAIKNDGTLWGCGNNQYGSLGINSTMLINPSFQQITTANNWIKVAPTYGFTIALKADGTIWAWGQNNEYQLGNSPATPEQLTPLQVGNDTDWVEIAAGTSSTSFAIKVDGTIWGWGSNPSSIIVTGSSTYTVATPTQVGTDTDWFTMSVGAAHVLAQKQDSTLWSWGGGGGLGLGGTPTVTNTPQQISIDKWISFSAGTNTSFGIKEDGTLWAWGLNTNGQLADGTSTDRLVPTQIGVENNWATVQAGRYVTTMATKTDGTVWYWGRNYYGEFGNGSSYGTAYYNTPIQTQGICVDPICDIIDVSTTLESGTITALSTGQIYQWIDCANNTVIPGETDLSFTPIVDGSYAVIITEGFCSDTSTCVLIETISLYENDLNHKLFTISPNPAKEMATVYYEISSEGGNLEVYDLSGRSISKKYFSSSKGEIRLNTGKYQAGAYIVVLRQNNGQTMQQKLIIE